MFGQFLKPRWQHKDPAIRERAVAQLQLGNPEQAQILATLARGDAVQAVRRAAISRLSDMKLLDQMQQQDHDDSIRDAAAEQIRRLLAGLAEHSPSRENRLRLIGLTDNNAALEFVARHSQDAECRSAATARLSDQQALLRLALDGADEPTRVTATERLSDAEALRQLVRDGRDKRVLRLAREQLKQVNAREQQSQQAAQRCQTLIKELTAHTTRLIDNLYAPRLTQLQQAWQQVAEFADDSQQQLAAQLIQTCVDRLDALAQQAQAAQQQQQAQQECAAALQTLVELQQSLQPESWLELNSLRALIATQRNRWQAACEELAAIPAQQSAVEKLFSHWQQCFDLLDGFDQHSDVAAIRKQWPKGFVLAAALQQQSPTEVAAEPDVEADDDDARALRKSLTKLLATLQRELQQRNLKHANRLWRKAEALLQEDKAPDWQPRLEKLRPQLDELRDWHAFAAEPKKQQLCEQMEALITRDMDVEEKAGAIHALHDDWRELMSADQQSDQALWERFRSASDSAYAPCREHFREQDAIKQANTDKRRALLEQLQSFIAAQDWAQANWSQVFDIRRTAPKEWSSYQPIDFTRARDLSRQFSAVLKQLDEQLDQASQQHAEQLEGLLEQASALLADVLPRNSVDQWKTLQQRWNSIGWVQPNRYRALHKKFRKLGDQLFAQLDAERQQQNQENQQQQQALKQAMQSLGDLLKADNAALDLTAIQQQADALASLPCPARDKSLEQKRQDLLRAVRGLRKWQQLWTQWRARYEQIDAAPMVEENSLQRQLAVALEAAAGCDSPADARDERMQWQLQQLQKAMTGANDNRDDAVAKLLEQHRATLDAGLSAAVRQRLLAVLSTLEPRR